LNRCLSNLSSLLLLTSAVSVHGGGSTAIAPLPERPFVITGQKDIPLFSAGISAAAAAFAIEHSTAPLTLDDVNGLSRNSVNRFDRGATYNFSKATDDFSDIFVYCVLAAPLALLTDRNIRATSKTFSAMYAETVIMAYALPGLGKGLFKRPRPFVYNPRVPSDEKLSREARVSFFSRHTTFAFASACFMSTVHGTCNPGSSLTPYVWAGSLAAASAVGYLRFAAGAHFPTDILTGALVGSIIGCGIPFMHTSKSAASRLSLDTSGNALSLSLEW
jgi:membrane-associated phospholipid phosphatase